MGRNHKPPAEEPLWKDTTFIWYILQLFDVKLVTELVVVCNPLYFDSIVNSILFGFFCKCQKQCVMILMTGFSFEIWIDFVA